METNEANTHKRDIIIIEDSLTVATLLRDFLHKLGYQNIHICENGATGIRIFDEFVKVGKSPLVFLDYGLPDMEGGEVMKEILSISPDTKIILETASEKTEESIKDAIRHGAYNYLGKPIRFEDVKNIIDTFEKEDTIAQHPEPATQKQIEALMSKPPQAMNLKLTAAVLITGFVIVTFLGLFAYQTFSPVPMSTPITTGRPIIENLKGDVIDTWVAWRLIEGDSLHIIILNSEIIPDDKFNSIKNAILSEETLKIENSLVDKLPQESSSVYYKGWKGALEKASESNVVYYIPTNFDVIKGEKAIGEVSIILSEIEAGDGSLAFTRSIADENEHQLLKSFITVFDVKNLSNEQMEAIIRHEFGHALGLAHSTASEDLMYTTIKTKYPYISECDVDAIVSLYDEKKTNLVICEN
ncbi:MAG TPA: response regulator [Nitrosopumilaceae archaeon]|nr:response regulator [Nitrosopumilaceae archaeon]